jgi:hypothetical protein
MLFSPLMGANQALSCFNGVAGEGTHKGEMMITSAAIENFLESFEGLFSLIFEVGFHLLLHVLVSSPQSVTRRSTRLPEPGLHR